MLDMTLEIGLSCSGCDDNLDATLFFDKWGRASVKIDPCEKCLKEAEFRGYDRASKEQQEAVADEHK